MAENSTPIEMEPPKITTTHTYESDGAVPGIRVRINSTRGSSASNRDEVTLEAIAASREELDTDDLIERVKGVMGVLRDFDPDGEQ